MDTLEQLFSLRGRIGLVTGASSGLGVECARALALAGADVALVARRAERLERLAEELRARYKVRTLALPADITVDAECERVVAEAERQLGTVDVLVNNAGVAVTGRAENLAREQWDWALAVNLTAPMVLAQCVARRLIAQNKPGRIINVCSIYGYVGSGVYRLAPYVASKGGMANLTRQLAVEWARYGINVNAIAPGWFPTEMNEEGMKKPGNRERMEQFTVMGRLGRPEELRGAVVFLASEASTYVTGSVVCVDGGYLAW